MPRRRIFKRKRLVRRKPVVKRLTRKVNKIVRAMRGELTHYDDIISAQGMHTSGVVFQTCAIGGGTNEGQRHGNTCALKRLRISGQVISNVSNVNNQTVRLVVAMRKSNPQLSTPDITDIYTDPARPYAPLTTYAWGDYKVLYDKMYTIRASQSSVIEKFTFRKTISLKEIKQEYQTSSSATCENNGIYVFVCGDTATGAQPAQLVMYNRLEFYP